MRALIAALIFAAGCAAAEPAAPPAQETAQAPPASHVQTPADTAPTSLTLRCAGALEQGGVALCRTLPGAAIFVDGAASGAADGQGWAIIGFVRDAALSATIEARANGASVSQNLAIADRTFGEQRVDGLPQDTVTPSAPETLARIHREAEVKQAAFTSIAPLEGWLDGFIWPVDGRVSSSWGNQRILNGVPNTPHWGVDIAAPVGTPIRAPASGVVTLAENDMFYEGGLVFIDHGEGLITMYLHMSRLDVHVGDHVNQGQVIGAVGDRGRATGPHLCWRMKWRDRQLDPSTGIATLRGAGQQLAGAP